MTALTLRDIADQRAYEHERDEFRREVIALKKIRRIGIGPLLTVVCENATTIRFQVQEMARAEKMTTDEQIQGELDTYNPLIPGLGVISMTLFLELTSEEELRTWLPRLVGIERSLVLVLDEESDRSTMRIPVEVEEEHAAQLTRDEITASVHYVRFRLDSAARARFAEGPAAIETDHAAYRHSTELPAATRASILADWDSTP